jgi:transcriptional regulator with GAF, ATPase, and Fis domain
VLPHDAMGLALVDEDLTHAKIYAVSSNVDFDRPEVVPLGEAERGMVSRGWEHDISEDITGDPIWRDRPPARVGFRAMMRVPIRGADRLTGGLSVFSKRPSAFSLADAPVLRRVADYVALALSHQRLAEQAARAAESRERAQRLERRVEALTRELATLSSVEHRIVGRSPAWRAVLEQASRVAPTGATVLLTGESGTGKELIARLIHRESPRSQGPFVAINCAALPEPLLESELFGAERGAFTGAVQARAGRLEQAAGGTLFLDEVAEMSPAVQAKLLRVLEEREFQRLGGQRTIHADVRVIAATNRDLRRLMDHGTFRRDLFYRLHVFAIHLPALRDRADDILRLTAVFLEDAAASLGRPVSGLSADARPALLAYSWPGNVRELRNAVERAAILADGGLVTHAHLNLPEEAPPPGEDGARRSRAGGPYGEIHGGQAPDAAPPAQDAEPLRAARPAPAPIPGAPGGAAQVPSLSSVERALVQQALQACGFNKAAAARALGLSRTQLYGRLRKYGIG